MKKLLFLSILLAAFAYPQGAWQSIQSPVKSSLHQCVFIDSLNGWVSGDSGKVLFTSDGGNNWLQKNLPANDDIINADFHSIQQGWVITTHLSGDVLGSGIYSTNDGGNNWSLLPFPYADKYFGSIKFVDSLKGFAGGVNNRIVTTSDGGMSWSECIVTDSIKKTFFVNEFSFYNKQFGFAYGGLMDLGGIVWRTTNGGATWQGKNISSEPIRKIHFFDSLNVIAIGGDAEYGVSRYRSYDGGITWNVENLSYLAIPYDLSFRTNKEAWVPLGYVTSFLVTVDSGKTWTEEVMPETFAIYDIAFPDSLHGYAAGLDGIILKYVYNPTSIIDEKEYAFTVYQNYPNPFNPETVISFSLKQNENVRVTVYDILGKEISNLADERFSEGFHKLVFNGEGLSSGVYFYKVKGESFSIVRKMLLVR